MFELTINGVVYSFNFGFGFFREIDKQIVGKADSNGVSRNMGLQYKMAEVMDANPLAIVDVLNAGNKYAKEPRITRDAIEQYVESVEDLDGLAGELMDFFRRNNTTKGVVKMIDTLVAMSPEQKAEIMKLNK